MRLHLSIGRRFRMLRHKLFVVVGMIAGSVATAAWLSTPQAVAQEKKPTEPQATKDITLEQAYAVTRGAFEKATQINTKMDIAVVDAGGNLKSFIRMDGAWIGSIDIAQKKARTARFFDMPTGE